MKKFLMSLMAIVITIITVGTMYISTLKLENKDNDNSYTKELKNENSIDIKNKTNQNPKENKDEKNNKSIDNKTNKDDRIEKENQDNLVSNKDNSSKKVEKKESISVFKVNKHTLLQNLPVKDKFKLLYMCKGLSTIDMANIKEYMKSSNEIEASSEIFKILRQRLSKEDYNEIKKILNPYVNIEYIENNM